MRIIVASLKERTMKRFSIFGLVLALATNAYGQQVMDGSDKDFDAAVVQQIVAAMQPKNAHPRAVYIRGMRRATMDQTTICGFVSMEDRYGMKSDFEPFIIYADTFYLRSANQCQ
jgi:hypothetical protein